MIKVLILYVKKFEMSAFNLKLPSHWNVFHSIRAADNDTVEKYIRLGWLREIVQLQQQSTIICN